MKSGQYARMRSIEDDFFWFVGLRELVGACLERFCPEVPHARILDAGCGTGALTAALGAFGRVQGLDASEEAVRFCRERGLDEVSQQDLNEWMPRGDTFDAMTCMDVLYHESIVRESVILQKFHEALKPSGLLLLNVPAFEGLRRRHDKAVNTRRRYRKAGVLSLIRNARFEPLLATYRLPILFPVLLMSKACDFIRRGHDDREMRRLPAVLNRGLLFLHRRENQWILKGRPLPFGSSFFVAARKKGSGF